jgi:hypothetical protein
MTENEMLRSIIKETLWMARRYASGRQTYAPAMYNEAAKKAVELGVITAKDFGEDQEIMAIEPGIEYGDDQ